MSLKKRKQSFNKLTKNRLNETTKLTNQTNFDDLIHYYINIMTRKRLDNVDNAIKLFEKLGDSDLKVEEQNMNKICLNHI